MPWICVVSFNIYTHISYYYAYQLLVTYLNLFLIQFHALTIHSLRTHIFLFSAMPFILACCCPPNTYFCINIPPNLCSFAHLYAALAFLFATYGENPLFIVSPTPLQSQNSHFPPFCSSSGFPVHNLLYASSKLLLNLLDNLSSHNNIHILPFCINTFLICPYSDVFIVNPSILLKYPLTKRNTIAKAWKINAYEDWM